MRDDNGRAIPADNSTLLYKTIQQKAGKHLGFAASDHDVSGVTIVEPDVISASWLDNNKNFQRYENAEVLHSRRFIPEHLDPPYDISSPTNRSTVNKRGIGVYNQPGELYITDQFKPVLHGDFGQDYTATQTINPGDLLTIGSGVNAGKMVKVNVNSIGTDIIVVGVVDKYDTNSGLLSFTNAFYSITFSSSSAILALDAGNSLSFPNTGTIGTICGTVGEPGSFTLTAPVGHVFDKVLFASYGNPDGTCGNFSIGACHAAASQSIVEGLLLGNSSVTLSASNGVFGDPCPGTSKRLYVQARFAPTQAKDLTVNNNNGTITNGVTYDTAGGGSWSFDGTNDYITLGNNTSFNFASGFFTISVWVNFSNVSGQRSIITNYQSGSNGWSLQLFGGVIIASYSGDGIDTTGTTVIQANTWYYITITGQPGTYKLHINGIQDGSTYTGIVNLSGSSTIIGQIAGSSYFNGNMTDIRAYTRVLSASEILAYYNTTKARYGL